MEQNALYAAKQRTGVQFTRQRGNDSDEEGGREEKGEKGERQKLPLQKKGRETERRGKSKRNLETKT